MGTTQTCSVVRPGGTCDGKQGLTYTEGISADRVRATGISMHLLTLPPGARAAAHLHETHETAIYIISGESEMWYGEGLTERLVVRAGDMLYIPANMPHLPMNSSDQPCTCVLARTDPNEQESVVLLPELESVVCRE